MRSRRPHTVEGVADQKRVRFARELHKQPTEGEAVLWEQLRRSGLGARFRRQHPIDGFILDFYCAESRLAVEVDGASHAGRREYYDVWRDRVLKASGIRVLRFTESQGRADLDGVVHAIKQALGESGS